MKIEILFTKRDLERIFAEHCRKQFKIDPKNVEILLEPVIGEYLARVQGDYRPD